MSAFLTRAPPWPSFWCASGVAGQRGVLAGPKPRMSTSSEADDETGAASSAPCEWGRRAAAAPTQESSAVTRTGSEFSTWYILHDIYTSFLGWVVMLLVSISLKHLFTVHLNDIATKGPPETLLLRIVEFIVGEVPGVFHFRLGHILIETSPFSN